MNGMLQNHTAYPSTQEILMTTRISSSTTHKPTPSHIHVTHDQSNTSRHDFEGMPPPGFGSGWRIETHISKKRKILATDNWGNVKNCGFPIGLDSAGRPTKSVQLGPKKSLRAPLGLK
jgi:hypothetical protein